MFNYRLLDNPILDKPYRYYPLQVDYYVTLIKLSPKGGHMLPLLNAIQHYNDYCYTLSPKTRKIYQEHLMRLFNTISNIPLEEITNRTMIKFMANLQDKHGHKYSPAYEQQIYRSLYSFFEYCIDEDWITENPLKRVPKPIIDIGPKARLQLSQVDNLIKAVKDTNCYRRNLVIVLLLLDSGLRLGEVAGLNLAHIRMDDGTVFISHTKTHMSREVPLSEETITALTVYLKYRKPQHPQEKVLLISIDGKPLSKSAITLLMRRLQNKLGFKLHAHLLRHTFANLYIRKGNLRKLQKILGHSRIDTTARFYTDPDLDDIIYEHKYASPTAQLKNTKAL